MQFSVLIKFLCSFAVFHRPQCPLLKLVIISPILMTLLFDSGEMLQREIRCYLLFEVKWLIANVMDWFLLNISYFYISCRHHSSDRCCKLQRYRGECIFLQPRQKRKLIKNPLFWVCVSDFYQHCKGERGIVCYLHGFKNLLVHNL